MAKTIIDNNKLILNSDSTFKLVNWPEPKIKALNEKVIALQTTRLPLTTAPHLFSNKLNPLPKVYDKNSSYDHFNLGLHVGDNEESVKVNRHLLNQTLFHNINNKPINPELKNSKLRKNSSLAVNNIQWLNQVHGNKVVTISRLSTKLITADASITRQKHLGLAIMTADCLPILLSHRDGDEIAAIHGGWRSLEAGIIKATLDEMLSSPGDVIAWLGPCIGPQAFQVGKEVRDAFICQDSNLANGFIKQHSGKYLADLHFIATHQLRILGVQYVATYPECTFNNENKYYSYRRNAITGRMASVICKY